MEYFVTSPSGRIIKMRTKPSSTDLDPLVEMGVSDTFTLVLFGLL